VKYIIRQIIFANVHERKRCWVVSTESQKQYF
jgi:hypothetical protein